MFKKTLVLLSVITLFVAGEAKSQAAMGGAMKIGENTIIIEGKVEFDEPQFKMEIQKRDGFDVKVVAEFDINPDGTYCYMMDVKEPGQYTLDCKKWQSVEFWAEKEHLEINFRGKDTAKMVVKNPPYVYIKGGPLNEVMNQYNFLLWNNYQLMIAVSQASYKTTLSDDDKQALSMTLYDAAGDNFDRQINFLAEMYADRSSVLALFEIIGRDGKNPELIDRVIKTLEAKNPNYAPLVKYKKDRAEEQYQRERLAIGKPAPDFKFTTPDGKKKLGISSYKGKILVVDFWASWCGPCRQEIPHMKEVYEKYKKQGVEILGVSIDKKDSDWKKALAEEKMAWPQVCAPDAGKDIMKEYQFSGIPYIILIGKNGEILAKGLRGNSIDEAIEAALKAK